MAKGFGDRPTVKFIELSDRKQEVTVLSELGHWISHWDPAAGPRGRSRKCGGRLCYCCHVGMKKQLRVVVLVLDGQGREWLFELRERHREKVDRCVSLVGQRLRIWKAGSAGNSPVEIKLLDQVYAIERDLQRLIECLGLPPVLIGELEGSVDGRSASTLENELDPFPGSGESTRST